MRFNFTKNPIDTISTSIRVPIRAESDEGRRNPLSRPRSQARSRSRDDVSSVTPDITFVGRAALPAVRRSCGPGRNQEESDEEDASKTSQLVSHKPFQLSVKSDDSLERKLRFERLDQFDQSGQSDQPDSWSVVKRE